MDTKTGFVDPTAGSRKAVVRPALRPEDLAGKVVGLLDNTKEQAELILQTIGGVLKERFGAKEVIFRKKEHYSKPADDAIIEEMALQCDVVICALGG